MGVWSVVRLRWTFEESENGKGVHCSALESRIEKVVVRARRRQRQHRSVSALYRVDLFFPQLLLMDMRRPPGSTMQPPCRTKQLHALTQLDTSRAVQCCLARWIIWKAWACKCAMLSRAVFKESASYKHRLQNSACALFSATTHLSSRTLHLSSLTRLSPVLLRFNHYQGL